MLNARITAVLTKNNRPVSSEIFARKFEDSGIKMDEV
jgi:hypothetical protein